MKYPSGEIYFGYGKTISINININNDIKILKNNDYSILTNNDKVLNFFGGLSFDLDNKNHYPWAKIPKGRFLIPCLFNTIDKRPTKNTTINGIYPSSCIFYHSWKPITKM